MFVGGCVGYAAGMAPDEESNATTKPGPANPQGSRDLDAPTPPGGPMRSDAPAGGAAPGGPGTPVQPGEPHESSTPERTIDEPVGPPDNGGADAGRPDPNAESSQGEPSDDAGHA